MYRYILHARQTYRYFPQDIDTWCHKFRYLLHRSIIVWGYATCQTGVNQISQKNKWLLVIRNLPTKVCHVSPSSYYSSIFEHTIDQRRWKYRYFIPKYRYFKQNRVYKEIDPLSLLSRCHIDFLGLILIFYSKYRSIPHLSSNQLTNGTKDAFAQP